MHDVNHEKLLGCPACGSSEELSASTVTIENIFFDVNGNFQCEEIVDYGGVMTIQCACGWSMGEDPLCLHDISKVFIEEHTVKVKQEFLKELRKDA